MLVSPRRIRSESRLMSHTSLEPSELAEVSVVEQKQGEVPAAEQGMRNRGRVRCLERSREAVTRSKGRYQEQGWGEEPGKVSGLHSRVCLQQQARFPCRSTDNIQVFPSRP